MPDNPKPKIIMKAASRQVAKEYEFLHPRMIYEVLNEIKKEGFVSAHKVKEIVDHFQDLNIKEK